MENDYHCLRCKTPNTKYIKLSVALLNLIKGLIRTEIEEGQITEWELDNLQIYQMYIEPDLTLTARCYVPVEKEGKKDD